MPEKPHDPDAHIRPAIEMLRTIINIRDWTLDKATGGLNSNLHNYRGNHPGMLRAKRLAQLSADTRLPESIICHFLQNEASEKGVKNILVDFRENLNESEDLLTIIGMEPEHVHKQIDDVLEFDFQKAKEESMHPSETKARKPELV